MSQVAGIIPDIEIEHSLAESIRVTSNRWRASFFLKLDKIGIDLFVGIHSDRGWIACSGRITIPVGESKALVRERCYSQRRSCIDCCITECRGCCPTIARLCCKSNDISIWLKCRDYGLVVIHLNSRNRSVRIRNITLPSGKSITGCSNRANGKQTVFVECIGAGARYGHAAFFRFHLDF